MTLSRRNFLLGAGSICLSLIDDLRMPGSRSSFQSSDCSLIPRGSPPLPLEMPISAKTSWITPLECFYVFNHSELLQLNTESWTISILGAVDRPMQLTLAELAEFEQFEVTNTLECAGNGRAFFRPHVSGVQWERGAVGNAIFRGPRLHDILASVGVWKSAKHVAFTGIDTLPTSKPQFLRSIPLEKALNLDTILATSMNGRALSPAHGFPIRAITPGWIGAASVKRVSEIRILEHEAGGEYMRQAYRIAPAGDEGSVALTSLHVKSIITDISKPQGILQPVIIRGAAWGGESEISKVEVSFDSGENWHPTRLQAHDAKYAWTFWNYAWTPRTKGQFGVFVKATDSAGRTQREIPKWNPRGYLWNGIDHRQITIE